MQWNGRRFFHISFRKISSIPYPFHTKNFPFHIRTAKSNLNSKELNDFAELELELKKIFFLNSNSNKSV